MNPCGQARVAASAAATNPRSASGGADLLLLAGALLLANLPLLTGASVEPLVFRPDRVAAGEWWRALSFPFVHVSLYHLALDAGAFLILLHSLRGIGAGSRIRIAAGAAAGSLAAAFLDPALAARGLCGLSGPAHGLMAASALDMLRNGPDRTVRRTGWAALIVVAAKSVVEAVTGSVFLAELHFGNVGAPVALCHLGGVIGGAAAWAAARKSQRPCQCAARPSPSNLESPSGRPPPQGR